jgi:hypothetical protein
MNKKDTEIFRCNKRHLCGHTECSHYNYHNHWYTCKGNCYVIDDTYAECTVPDFIEEHEITI